MRRLLLLATLSALFIAAGLGPAGAAPPGGFVLQDTDAAYVDFTYGSDCNVFVGYVSTDRLLQFGVPGGFMPHSDLEVKLAGSCGNTDGVVNTLGDGRASFTTLTDASIASISVVLGDGRTATVDITWTATGDVIEWKQKVPGNHASHETRLATVVGSVTITDGGTTWSVDENDVWYGTETLEAPRITFYDEVQTP